MRRGGKTGKGAFGSSGVGALTALHLVAHVTTVVPAVTLQLFGDADTRSAGELVGASCSQDREEGGNRGGKKKRRERRC